MTTSFRTQVTFFNFLKNWSFRQFFKFVNCTSVYPDPFREEAQHDSLAPGGLGHTLSQTITKANSDGTSPTPHGHRRNVSDTSAFNK